MSKLVRPCGVSVNRGVTSDSVYVVFGAVQSANKPHTHLNPYLIGAFGEVDIYIYHVARRTSTTHSHSPHTSSLTTARS